MSENKNNFGCGSTIGSIAALLTAIGTLLTVLYQIGVIGPDKQPDSSPSTPISEIGQYEEKTNELEQKIADIDATVRRTREAELKAKLEKLEQQLKEREGQTSSYASNMNTDTEPVNLTGSWYTTATPGVSYKIVQYDESVTFEEISSLFGIPTISAAGNGSISGNTLKLSYNTLFGTQGKGSLRIKDNGNLLSGSLTDLTSGMVMSMSLQRE